MSSSNNYLINGLGGDAGFGENILGRNDDNSTGYIDITSVFESGLNFFGTTYNGFYINNNGNITFRNSLSTYTPFALTGNTGTPIIAPFFTDIDTRAGSVTPSPGGNSTGSNLVYWDIDSTSDAVTVTWDDVGQYSYGTTPNAFQLRLKDIGAGNFTVELRYEDIQWYGGNARAGYSAANGINFFELPQSGTSSMLDLETASNINQPGVFLFSVVNGIPNQPPTDVAISQLNIDENSLNGTVIATLTTTDPDANDFHTYTLLDNAGGRFAINGNKLVVANGALLNYETSSSHNIIVRAKDIGGLTYDKSFTISINNVPEPDLSITAATSPTTANLGETIQVNWTVTNQGDGTAFADWGDYVYLSEDTILDDSDAWLITRTIDVQTPLAPNGTYNQQVDITIPQTATTGNKYLLFVTDRNNNEREDNKANNLKAKAITITAPDLRVDSLVIPDSATLGKTINFSWTVRNAGDGVATQNWRDRFYLSTDSIISDDDRLLWTENIENVTPLAPGATYTKNATATLPLEPNLSEGNYYILFKTDAENKQLEASETNNTASASRFLTLPPLPDLVVSGITAPATEFSGQRIQVSWTLQNQGNGVANGISTWSEQIYLSSDQIIGNSDDQLIKTFNFTGTIQAGQSVTRIQEITLPIDWSGERWIVVKTDTSNQIYEHNKESNNVNVSTQPINIRLSPFPNLQVTSITPPASAASGNQTEVSWTVKNIGTGATNAPYWYDKVWLSHDDILDSSDYYLGKKVNPSYLNPDESYSSSLICDLPQGIDGNWQFIVKTDAPFSTWVSNYPNGLVYEYNREDDNIKVASPTKVQLTAPPDLQVTKVTIAPTSPFSGQQVTLNWTVSNKGLGRTAPGESSWYDQLYMAKNPDGTGESYDLGRVIHNSPLQAGEFYNASLTVNLPIGKWNDYFFVVVTDAGKQVYEQAFEDNNIGFFDADKNDTIDTPTKILLTPPPDLTVDSVTGTATALAGKSLTINYQVSNKGATAVPARTSNWSDAFYLSTTPTLNTSTALYLGSKSRNGVLDTDQFYKESATFTLPNDIIGDYYVFVVTDSGNSVFEQDDVDTNTALANISRTVNPVTVISRPADLVVTALNAPTTVTAGKTARISWSVLNQGTGDTIATRWTDRLIASQNDVLGDSDDVQLSDFTYNSLLLPRGTYERAEDILIPFQLVGNYKIFLTTDKYGEVYEGSNENNNSSKTSITANRQTPDLEVIEVVAPATAASGTLLPISWKVKNIGTGSTNVDYWYDEIFLSSDKNIDANDTLLGTIRHNSTLAADSSYNATADLLLPLNLSGSFYVLVRTDSYSGYDAYGNNNRVLEVSENNNTANATPATFITLSPVPELTVNSVDAPTSVVSGQSFSLTWSVSNTGASTGERTWYDAVYLSRDQVFDRTNGDIYLGSFIHNGGLVQGQSYTETQSFNVPRGLSGPFYAFVVTDSSNAIDERGSKLNNISYDSNATQVILPPPADLAPVASSLTLPISANPGEIVTINYTVQNQGGDAALGNWYDAFYLSADNQWDINDVQIGLVQHFGDVTGGSSYNHSLTAALPGVIPGNYHVLLRSDIRNQVPETNESNNAVSSLGVVAVDFESLAVGGSASGTLQQGQAIYYKIQATVGQALKLHLDSLDNNSANELYIRYGQLPTRGQFDRTADNPFLADPDFVLPVNQDGTHYVMVYGNSVSGATNYTLTATDIPFSVTGVETNVVGNKGQATVKVKGARFALDTTFQLVDSQGNTISQSRVKIKDSTTAFVTFDLKGKKIGSYSIQAIQSSGATTSLTEALTVQEGVGAIINDAVGGPARVWAGQKYPISINYGNSGDTDTAAPLLLVRNKNSSTGINPRYENANQKDKLVQLYGAGADVETGLLRPRESRSIPLYFAHLGDENQDTGVSVETVSTEDNTFISADDWIMLKQSAKPVSITNADWSTFWSNIQPGIGDTWGDYAQLITQLSKAYNKPGESIYDVSELFARWYADKNSTFFQFRPKPSISGQLIDNKTGLPATEKLLLLYQEERPGRYFYELVTDQQGKFYVASLSPGTYKLAIPNGYSFVNTNNSSGSLDSGNAIYTIPVTVDSGDINLRLDINPPAPEPFDPSYLSLFRTQYPEIQQKIDELKNSLSSSNLAQLSNSSNSLENTNSYLLREPSSSNTPALPPPDQGGGGEIIWETPFGQIKFKPNESRVEERNCEKAFAKDTFSVDIDTPFGNPELEVYTSASGSLSVQSDYIADKEECLYKHKETKLSADVLVFAKSKNPLITALWVAEKFVPEARPILEGLRDAIDYINNFIPIEDVVSANVAIGGGFGGKVIIDDSGDIAGSISAKYSVKGGFDINLDFFGIPFKANFSISGTISQQQFPFPDIPTFKGSLSVGIQYGIWFWKGKFDGNEKPLLPLPTIPLPRIPGSRPVGQGLLEFFKRNLSDYSLPEECDCKPEDYSPTLLKSADPNDILGPDGYGSEKWIPATDPLDYTIRFENMPTATAPAKQVVITQKLDSDLDWRSFRLGSFGWGDLVFQVPSNRAFYGERIDLRDKYGIYADVSAYIDITTGEARWEIKAIDPETGDIPTDPLKGFLPPNNENRVGEGFVTYFVKSKNTLQTGARIDAQARIIFDNNEPIDTPSIFNTIDVGNPTSAVAELPSSINTPTFLVKWAGSDNGGSGLATYNVYISKDDAPFELWQRETTLTEATFTGEGGHTYKFYSLATDNAGNQQDVSTATPVTVEILSPGTLAFSAPTFSISEDGTALASVTVTRTNGSYGAVEVTLNLSGGTATGGTQPYAAGVDYDNSAITVSFADGENSKTITIPVNNDTQLEGNETINLSLSNPTGSAVIGQQSNAVLTLVDNDTNLNFNLTPEVEISAQVLTAFTKATSYWASLLSNAANINVTIGFRDLGVGILAQNVAERSNFAYADVYNALLTNRTSVDDFTSVSNLQSGSAFSLLLNRTSNNPAGSGSITPYLDNDGDANNTTIRVNRANAKALGLISANASGQDALLILNSNSSLTWDFDPSDGITPGAYDFVGLVTHEIGHTLGFDSGVDVLDSNPSATDNAYTYVTSMDLFRFSTASTAVGKGVIDWTASTTDKYFSIDGGTTKIASFATGVNYGDGQQSSHWKDNLGLGMMDPTIALGERIQISAFDKQMFDVIGWNLLDTNTNYAKLSFGAASFSISEDGTPINAVTVIRTGSTTGSVSATITLSDDTAIAGSDYNNTPIVVTFAPGETSKTVTIPITNDTSIETLENIKLTLSNPTGGATIGIQSTATLSILDDDVQLNFSASNYVVREDGTAVTNIIVTRTGRATGTVGGTITFTDGTATGCGCGPNSVNKDFYNGAITFTLGENETSKVIPVELASLGGTNAIRIRNDNFVEGDENFTISLANPTGSAVIGSTGSATIKILDDDVELAFSDTNFSINEDGTAIAAVTVTRTGRSSGAVGATITLTNGSAESPADYYSTPIIVNFEEGETIKTVLIPIVNDTLIESGETINLTLGNPTGGATIGSQNSATLTIVDDDVQLAFSNTNFSVNENGTQLAAVTITRTGRSTGAVGVTVTPSNGTATSPADYDGTPVVVNFASGETTKTVVIPVVDDTMFESNETVTLTLSNPTGGATIGVQSTATLTIRDNDPLVGTANDDTLIGGDGDDTIDGREGNDTLIGNAGNDNLIGGTGNDVLDGGTGVDRMEGNSGDDTYIVDNTSDTVIENSSSGTDTVKASVSFSIAALTNVENLTLTGNAFSGVGNALNNHMIGNASNNTLIAAAGNDTLDGGAGADRMEGGIGDDTYIVDNTGDTIIENFNEGTDTVEASVNFSIAAFANVENLILTGDAINGTGNTLNNRIIGNTSNNTLNGGSGADQMSGGAGDDIYIVDSISDTVIENVDAGTDTIQAFIDYSIATLTNIENLTLTNGTSGTGNALNNRIIGNSLNNTLNGGAGNDTMEGGTGDDTYIVDSAADTIVEGLSSGTDTVQASVDYSIAGFANVENLTLTGSATSGTGNALSNRIIGNAQNNILNGGAGSDTMSGGAGDDTYIVDSAGDTVVENASEGVDTVESTVTFSIAGFTNVENLTLTGMNSINGTGNALNNRIIGNNLNNTLNGGAGNDTMEGGAGDDTYIVDSGADTIIENLNSGTDTIQSSIDLSIAGFDNVENLTLTGGTSGTGNALNNRIIGNSLNNTLNGGVGNDTMEGGAGDDTYIVDSAGDTVVEFSGNGTDTVTASVNFSIAGFTNVENLTLTGLAVQGTGNSLNNNIIGNAQNNILDGGTGADRMEGGTGDDTYIVDSTFDTIVENASSGIDTIQASVDFSIAGLINIENLTLTGTAINGTGNSLNNSIVGNATNNTLNGGTGADRMEGGNGNDTYIVDNIGDTIIENATSGIDTVQASVDFSIAGFNEVENLTLTGNAISGTGNSLNNRIIGNSLNNILDGSAGNDTMEGGTGDDTYIVDSTGDTIVEFSGYGTDTVTASIDFSIAGFTEVENLTLTGGAISGIGNSINNRIVGNATNNTLDGGAGNDILDGGAGNDTLIGGFGDDRYIVDSLNDIITENVSSGLDIVEASIDYSIAGLTNIEELVLTGSAVFGTGNSLSNRITGNSQDNVLIGNAGSDILIGGAGNDTLDGGIGNDTLDGGIGDDIYIVDSTSDFITENASSGMDTIQASVDLSLSISSLTNVENLTLIGNAISGAGNSLNNRIIGNAQNNILNGSDGNDILDGGVGNDTLDGGTGNDTLDGGAGNDNLNGSTGNDVLIGDDGDDTYTVDSASDSIVEALLGGIDTVNSLVNWTLGDNVENLTLIGGNNGTGNSLNNRIIGNSLNNILDGSTGADRMEGGTGDDIYIVDSTADTIVENTSSGIDTIQASVDFSIASLTNVENLTLTGSAVLGTGNSLTNRIVGNALNNILDGGTGSDTLEGGNGDDTYIVDSSGDIITENANSGIDTVEASVSFSIFALTNVENLTLTLTSAINGTGNSLNNRIKGNNSNNIIDGGAGSDTMSGGSGDDTYTVDSTSDSVVEALNEGTDTVNSSVNWTLGDNVENLTLTGSAINGTGNSLNNRIIGNSLNNILDGGAGSDTMEGGTGDDIYIVDSTGDTIVEFSSSGVDTVQADVSFSIAGFTNVENLTLTGLAISATGNFLNNRIVGNAANNILDGGSGSDTMSGGTGDDTYIVDSSFDTIVENASSGIDTIQASVDFSIAGLINIENLTLTGTAISGTGNSLSNSIVGNTQNNILNGGAGDDTMSGGAGDDTYVVDSANDTIVENLSSGTDTVQASVDYSIAAFNNVENLTLTGNAINGTGNALNNRIIGNNLNNTLDGGSGNDTMEGGVGNDIYIVDSASDTIVENTSSGTDTVQASVNFSIAAFSEVENLTLTGNAINGTGNSLSNRIIGNALNNILNGGAGSDTMEGGAGDDTYIVDNASDTVIENADSGADTIEASFNFSISGLTNIENLTLTGSAITGTGNSLSNRITGNTLDNTLNGDAGNDTLIGGAGNDNLNGGTGDDTLDGGAGNDTYTVDSISDSIVENANAGTDTVNASVSWTLGDNLENLTNTGTNAITGTGNALNNTIQSNTAGNSLFGNDGNDNLTGNIGNDLLDGGTGSDTLLGNSGNDMLVGGFGNDTLTGGIGVDTFVLNNPNQGIDSITDFSSADDTLQVSAAGFGGGLIAGATISADQILIGSGNVTTNATQRFIYNTSTGALFFDADGNQTGFGAVQIATLSNKPLISSNDIFATT